MVIGSTFDRGYPNFIFIKTLIFLFILFPEPSDFIKGLGDVKTHIASQKHTAAGSALQSTATSSLSRVIVTVHGFNY